MHSSSAHDARTAFAPSPERSSAPAPRELTAGQCAVAAAYVATGIGYFLWRPTTFNPDAPVFSMLLYAAELFGFVVSALHLFLCWRLSRRAVPTPLPGLSVDVFVNTLDEPLSMLRRTLLAAREMDYPHRTWLLDEADRPQMQALAEELGVGYLACDLGADGTACKLNHALRQTGADFVAIFDADHVPARHFLTRTLGFFRDDRVAFVQTPQGICNVSSLQHRTDRGRRLVWNEQAMVSRVIQPGRDYWNAALFCGSCAVLRRAALDAVGGFATGTPNEELHTSLRLHKQRYKSVYLSESLVFAMASRNLGPFLKQQVRRSRGALQVWAREGIVFCRGLSFPQRASYVATVLAYFNGWQKGVFYFSPAVVLLFGVMPIAALDTQFLLHFLPYLLLSLWSFEEVGRGYGRTSLIAQFNMARFGALVAAAVGTAGDPGRSSIARKSGSGGANTKYLAWPQQTVLVLSLAAVLFGLAHQAWHQTLSAEALAASVLWALLNAGLAAAALSVTLKSVPSRRADYRFAIPLPARLKFPVDEPVYGIVDNISSSGFRFHGRFPEYAQFGAKVSGELYLPGGALPLQATIRSFYLGHEKKGDHHGKSVGLSFDVVAPGDEGLLERFLCGSDLQWRINELIDRSETPVGLLARLFRCGGARHFGRPEHWAPAILQGVDAPMSRPEVGLISLPVHRDALRRVLALAPAPVGKRLRVSVAASTARHPVEGTLAMPQVLDTPLAPIYDYAFAVDAWSKD